MSQEEKYLPMEEFGAKKILIDPAVSNKRAIRCYEKSGYKIIKYVNDGVTDCCIMQYFKEGE